MAIMFSYVSVAVLAVSLTQAHPQSTGLDKALKFGGNDVSYILMEPDLSPLSEALSVCSWIKRMRNSSIAQFWLSYVAKENPAELLGLLLEVPPDPHPHPPVEDLPSADGLIMNLFQDGPTTFTIPGSTLNEWHHVCLTWSYSTRTKRVYYDGEEIGKEATPEGRKLHTPGSMMLGQFHSSYGGGNLGNNIYFGGELHDLNLYSIQLTAEQVSEMFKQGRCSDYSKSYGLEEKRELRWEDILNEERHGNVVEVSLDCGAPRPPTSHWDVLYGKEFHGKEITDDLLEDMRRLWGMLEEFRGHKIDDQLIEHLKKHHSGEL